MQTGHKWALSLFLLSTALGFCLPGMTAWEVVTTLALMTGLCTASVLCVDAARVQATYKVPFKRALRWVLVSRIPRD